jgi:hypothetical protein
MPREQPEIKETRPADVVNIVFTLMSIHTACITPFIRSRFGSRAFAAYPFAALLMFFYAGFANCPLLAWYILPWMLMIAYRRVTASRTVHSRYQGRPWVGMMLGANEYVGRVFEIFICVFAAIFAARVSERLATFVLLEIPSLLIVLATETATLQARKAAMRDAQIEARQMSDLMRGGDGW